MSKISKTIAEQVAEKITEPLKNKIIECDQKISQILEEYIIETIPKGIMELFAINKSYFKTSSYYYLNCGGFSRRHVSVSKAYPYPNDYYLNDIPSKVTDKLFKIEMEKDKIKEKYKVTKSEIENSLLALGTYKRVETEMPQAYKFLPQRGCTSLIVNVAPVNEKINCLLSPDKKCMAAL